ncbi:MAG: hypothetical protein WC836_13430, partial [Desulfobacula sp.]
HSIEEKIFAGIQLKTDLFKGVFGDGPDTVEFSREKRNEMLNRRSHNEIQAPEIFLTALPSVKFYCFVDQDFTCDGFIECQIKYFMLIGYLFPPLIGK